MTLTRGLARVGAVLLSAIAAVPFLAAQVDPGDRVRVRLKTPPPTSGLTPYKTPPPSTHVGSVVTLGTDFLTVRTERDSAPLTFALASIRTLERHTGQHRMTSTGAVIGGVAGLLVGITVALLSPACPEGEECFFDATATNVSQVAAYSGLGVLAGAGVGALVGMQFHADTWSPVPLLQPGPTRLGCNNIGIAFSLRL